MKREILKNCTRTSLRILPAMVIATLAMSACIAARPDAVSLAPPAGDAARPSLSLSLAVDGIERVMPDDDFFDAASAGKLTGGDHSCMFGNEQVEQAARAAYEGSGYFSSVSADPKAKAGLHAFVRLRCLVAHSWTYYPFWPTAGIFPHRMEVGVVSTTVMVRKDGARTPPLNHTKLLRTSVWADTLFLLAGGWRESPGTAMAGLAAQAQREAIAAAAEGGLLRGVDPVSPGATSN
ncbi:MAG: hypothetical protein KDH09_00140 [Chrysiogenetes bacterium]|nr:hypothetical protein [Chrysiogenetes bacterium]